MRAASSKLWVAISAARPSDAGDGDQGVEHPAAGARVQIAGGLVGQQDARPVGQGAGDGDALLLAARQLRRAVRQPLAQAQQAQQALGLRRGRGRAAVPAIICGRITFSGASNSGSR